MDNSAKFRLGGKKNFKNDFESVYKNITYKNSPGLGQIETQTHSYLYAMYHRNPPAPLQKMKLITL